MVRVEEAGRLAGGLLVGVDVAHEGRPLGVARDLHHARRVHPRLEHPGDRRVPQVVPADARDLRLRERALPGAAEVLHGEDSLLFLEARRAPGRLAECVQLGQEPGGDRDRAGEPTLGISRAHADRAALQIHVRPGQGELLVAPERRVERADDERAQVGAAARALREYCGLLVARQYPLALDLVGRADERVAAAEGVLRDPVPAHRDVEGAAEDAQLVVYRRDAAVGVLLRLGPESALLVAAQVVVGDAVEREGAEVGAQDVEVLPDADVRAQPRDLAVAEVGRGPHVLSLVEVCQLFERALARVRRVRPGVVSDLVADGLQGDLRLAV